jgi:hypothetical protein
VTRVVRNDGRRKRPINLSPREIALDYLANCTREEAAPERARELGPCRVGLETESGGYAMRIGIRQPGGRVVPYWSQRWIKEQLHGPAPTGLVAVCLCGVRACVEPNHHQWQPRGGWTRERSTRSCACGVAFIGRTRARFCPDCRSERHRARQLEYRQRPEVRARQLEYRQRPEVRARYIAMRDSGVNAERCRRNYQKHREKRIAWQREYDRRKRAEKRESSHA